MKISYEVMWQDGRTESGTAQVESLTCFKQQQKTRGAIVISMKEVQARQQVSFFGNGSSMSVAQRCVFTRQMAGLVDAGLPIDKALLSLTKQTLSNRKSMGIVSMLQSLYDKVREGTSLSKAMEAYPRDFDGSYRAVIAAAEQSGAMGQVLEQLANELEATQSLRATLLAACLYPGIVSLFAIVMVLFLMTYVVPQVANVFASGNKALPTLTIVMLGISNFIRTWWWLGSLIGGAALILITTLYRKSVSGQIIDRFLLRLPLLGALLQLYNTARFSSTLALLTKSGVPILKALDTAAKTMGNRAMQEPLLISLIRIREGAGIANALEETKMFPEVLLTFAKLGEQTGRLPEMLGRVSTQLSTDVQRRSVALAGIIEPLLIVTMGLLVMLIVLSVLLPIIDLNTMIR